MNNKKEFILSSIYVSIIAAGMGILFYLSLSLDVSTQNLLFMGIFTLISLALMFKLVSIDANFVYSLEDVAAYAVIFLRGASAACWVSFLSSIIFEIIKLAKAWKIKKGNIRPLAILFNFANPFLRVLIVGTAGLVFEFTRKVNQNNFPFLSAEYKDLPAYTTCVLVFFGTSILWGTLLNAFHTELTLKNFIGTWKKNWKMIAPHLLMLAPLGMLLAVLYRKVPYASILLVVPVYILHTSMEAIRRILDEALNTIEFIAITLDHRDAYTYGHSERVSRYSAAIAARMELPADKVEEIRKAGIIHDLGKVTIPDSVLRKSTKLSDDEYSIMKSHTHAPAALFKSYTALSREIPLKTALYHHERYDGGGYMYSLKGEEIPLGSRILAVADAYDAMTSDRPYRKGMPESEAYKRMEDASGTQLDPEVVKIFLAMHREGVFGKIKEEYGKETEAGEPEAGNS